MMVARDPSQVGVAAAMAGAALKASTKAGVATLSAKTRLLFMLGPSARWAGLEGP